MSATFCFTPFLPFHKRSPIAPDTVGPDGPHHDLSFLVERVTESDRMRTRGLLWPSNMASPRQALGKP